MKKKFKGILISKNKKLHQDISNHLMALADVTDRTDSISLGYTIIKEKKPDLVLFDMTESFNDRINLTMRIKKIQPGTQIFFINTTKNSDQIIQGFRTGISDFLEYPFKGADLEDSVRKALTPGAGAGAEIFTIFSLKGGIGVTTTAINLADHIHDLTGDKVLLLDLNLFMGDICSYLNIKTSYSPFDFIRDMDRMDKNLLFSSLYCHEKGFYILTTPEEISDSDSINKEQILKMLSILKQNFDYIIVDCAHDFSGRTLNVCTASDKVLVLTQQNIPTAKSVQKVIEFFKELNFSKESIRVVINRYLKTNDMNDNDLEAIFQQKIFFTIENNYPLLARAANKGLTLDQTGKNNKINKEMKKMAEKLTGIRAPQSGGWKQLLPGNLIK